MAFTDKEMETLANNLISLELFAQVPNLNRNYYLSPYMYIKDTLNLDITCTGQEFRYAVEMANDEDLCPADAGLPVIVDGILAFIYADLLAECGMDLTTYFTYRFHPPSREFQARLDKFESLIKEAN